MSHVAQQSMTKGNKSRHKDAYSRRAVRGARTKNPQKLAIGILAQFRDFPAAVMACMGLIPNF
jgi:hypothetical protein